MNLGNLSVQELSLEEQINIDGGIIITTAALIYGACLLAGIAVGAGAVYAMS